MIRVSKRSSLDGKYVLLIRLSSILLAMAALGVFINFMGHNPFVVYKAMLEGCFGSAYRFRETIKTAIPLTITALGIMLAFKMKFWNIGAEGQIFKRRQKKTKGLCRPAHYSSLRCIWQFIDLRLGAQQRQQCPHLLHEFQGHGVFVQAVHPQ